MSAKELVEIEEKELHEKLVKLCDFLNSDNFDKLDDTAKSLLSMQFNTMAVYDEILQERLRTWREI